MWTMWPKIECLSSHDFRKRFYLTPTHENLSLCDSIQNILNKDDHDDDVPFIVLHTGMHNWKKFW